MKVMKDLKENWNVNFEDPQTAKKFEKVWLSYRDGMQTNAEKIGSIAQ